MTSAATPKGLRRRSRLIEAAGALLLEGGFDAVRHRAVAERAQLPLASTTYYFGSLEDLLAQAASQVFDDDAAGIIERGTALPRRRRGEASTADALADVFVGAATSVECLAARYEMLALAPRHPLIAEVVVRRRDFLRARHEDALDRCGRLATAADICRLIAVTDGAAISALATSKSPYLGVRDALTGVLELLAPKGN